MLFYLVLLHLIDQSRQDMTNEAQKYCTSNSNGDPYQYDLTPLGKIPGQYKVTAGEWVYHIALCGESNLDLGGGTKGDAIIQTKKGENHAVSTYIQSRSGGEMWVNMVFAGGDKYTHHCNGTERKAQILFICAPDKGNGIPILIDENNDSENFCFYMFEWSTNLVCPKNMKGPGKKGMGIGKLLLIEFVVIVIAYCVLGTAYRRFVVGARGLEQIPNLEFWKLCTVGIKETFSKVKGADNSTYNPSTNGGISSSALNIVTDDDDERLIM